MNNESIFRWIGIVIPVLSFIANLWLAKIVAELRLEIRNNYVTTRDCDEIRTTCKEIRRLEQEAKHAVS